MNDCLQIKLLSKQKNFLLSIFVFFSLLFSLFVFAQENKLPGDKRSIDIILMLDKSGSLDIEDESTKYALPAAKYLVDLIDVYQQKSGFNIRLAFIPFGDSVLDGFFQFKKLDSATKEKIFEEINTGNTSKKTDFVPPFIEAMNLFATSKGAKCLIFLFSDGIPELQGKKHPPESEVLNYFNTSGIKVFIRILTIIMDVDIEVIGFSDREYGRIRTREGNPYFVKKLWDELLKRSPGEFHSIGADIFEPIKVIHEILEKSFYGKSPIWSELKKGELVINLEPFLEWAAFTIIKEGQDDTLVIKNSKGAALSPDIQGNEGRYLIYYISPPIDEKWTVNLISDEKAWIGVNKRYPEIRFDLERKSKNRRHKGLPLLADSDSELELSCSIFKGDNIVIDKNINLKFDGKNMKYDGNGKYSHKIELSPDFEEPIVLKPKIEAFYNKKIIPLRKDITKFAVEFQKFAKKSDDYLSWVIGSIGSIFLIAFLTLLFISKRREKRKAKINKRVKKFLERSKNLSDKEIHKEVYPLLKMLKTECGTCEIEYFGSSEDNISAVFSIWIRAQKKQNEKLNLDDFLPIFDSIKNSPAILINCLAKVLWKDKWDNAPFDEIILGMYRIINRFENPFRILLHIAESSNHEAREVIKSMTEIYDSRDEELQQNLKLYLSPIRDAYQKFQDIEKLGVKGYAFFDYLSKLLDKIENTLYPGKIDYPDSSNLEIDCWKNSIGLLDDLNYLDKLDYEEALEKIRSSKENCPKKVKGPEAKILSSILKKWESELRSVSKEPVEIELSFAPELAISEEMIKDPSLSLFAILIKNNSSGHALDVNIKINSQRDGEKIVEIGKISKHSYCVTDDIFKIHDFEQTMIMANYNYYKKESNGEVVKETKTTNLSPYLDDVIENGHSNEECPYSLEPYSPGDIFVNRVDDITKIKSVIEENKSQILVVFGMRRVGKTSLINFLIKIFCEKRKNIKCINIPSSIFNRKHPWENDEFLGVLTRRILMERSISDYVEELSNSWDYQKINKMNLKSFEKFMNELMIKMNNQKLVIFFDDADYFEKKIKGNKKDLFPRLKDLLESFNKIVESIGENKNKGDFNIIFFGCSDVLGDNWTKTFLSNPLFFKEKILTLKLFEKDDLLKILHWGDYKVPFNKLSLEFLMRITGGHPALTQYICLLLKNETILKNKKYLTIPLSVLHKITKKITNDREYRNYCWYISRFSLPLEERKIFCKLLERVDSKTLRFEIRDSFEGKIRNLTKYQFIDMDSFSPESKTLRIGLFKLFPNNSFLVKNSIEDMIK